MVLHGLHVLLARLAPGEGARQAGRSIGDQVSQGTSEALGKGFEMIAVFAVGILVLIALAVVLIVVAVVRAHRRGRAGAAAGSRDTNDA
jgi:hypothetical protein